MKRQSGFTLIELMIVVAIVAILAAIALPAYQTYTKKSKMTQLVAATGALKTAVEVCAQTYGFGTSAATCTLNTHGMPQDEGDYSSVDLTYSEAISGGTTTIEAKPTDDSVLAPLTTSNTVTLSASSSVPVVWKITCDTNATADGYCPN
ncbi:pilin [Aeromonas sanarellii]|uniref:pilin n=1 Tax=Aeromonas sanarellii TaxID=633415 RepID=UPI003B9F4DF3